MFCLAGVKDCRKTVDPGLKRTTHTGLADPPTERRLKKSSVVEAHRCTRHTLTQLGSQSVSTPSIYINTEILHPHVRNLGPGVLVASLAAASAQQVFVFPTPWKMGPAEMFGNMGLGLALEEQ
ncbi:hypothetical protein PGTUg99_020875 [Puccinia graminis f. sp. tritici]|uniref:Uncharacterized protein n=1 Tax=Puccinia graminis f. sp. tritici TaxID=56615 RepID=A0A5B0Q8W9_PUCGR|nr:hypothetical protein PGTUg99_020875 [Puccinia graminis f. sp. tritici]